MTILSKLILKHADFETTNQGQQNAVGDPICPEQLFLPRSIVERMADKRTMPDFEVVVDLLPSDSGSVESPSAEKGMFFVSKLPERKDIGIRGLLSHTRHRELGREVPGEPLPGEVGDRAENDYGAGEAGVPEGHALVGRELGHGLGPHQVFPVILEHSGGLEY